MSLGATDRFSALSAVLFAVLTVSQAYGATVTLDAIQDTWISPTNTSSFRTTPRNGELIDVKSGSNSTSATTANSKRYGVVEFDLSSVTAPIIGATLQLYMLDGTPSSQNTGLLTMTTRLIPLAAHIDEATLTFDVYAARPDLGAADLALTSLGTFSFTGTGAVPTGVYTPGAAGSASDAALLETQRNTPAQLVGFVLTSASTSVGTWHQWSDREHNFAPQLILETVPEPTTACMAIAAGLGLALVRNRKNNPGA